MRLRTFTLLIVTVIVIAADGAAQGRRGGRFGMPLQLPENPSYDGGFQFCRIMFRNSGYGDGNGWYVD